MTVIDRALFALFLATLTLAGCAASSAPEPVAGGDQAPPAAPADAAPAGDAGPAPADDGGAASAPQPAACALAGTWHGSIPGGYFRGEGLTWVIGADGQMLSNFGPALVRSTATLAGGELSLVDHEAEPASVACPAEPPGRYAVTFGEGCATATLALVSDPCSGRRDTISGLTLTRR